MISPQTSSFSTAPFTQTALVSFALIYQHFILSTPSTTKFIINMFWISEWIISEDIMEKYILKLLLQNGCFLAECRICIYSLLQAGRFAYIKLVKHLSNDWNFTTSHTQGLFRHLILPATFNLIVDNHVTKTVEKLMLTN